MGELKTFYRIDARRIAPVTLVAHAEDEDEAVFAGQTDIVDFIVGPCLTLMVFSDQHRGMFHNKTAMLALR
jgi:hypothetical protein